jgi:hypothetical protein
VLALRLYIAVLAMLLAVGVLINETLNLLTGVVIVCAPLYLIFDIQAELSELKALEKSVSKFKNR